MLPEPSRSHDSKPFQDSSLDTFKDALRARYPLDVVVRRAARRRTIRRVIGGTMLTVVSAVSIWLVDPAYRIDTLQTAVGEHRDWSLADGSRLALNTGSSARIEWHVRSRRLSIERGEASIEVAHSPYRPLVTHAGDVTIHDIGTTFAVRRGTGDVRIGVESGSVAVAVGAHAPVTLQPNQSVIVEAGRIGMPERFDPADALGWRDGRLVFDGTPLSVAIVEIRRYRTAPVDLDPRVANLRLSGQFNTDNVDALLDMLPGILPLKVKRSANGAVTVAHR
ncbi:FecR family protein [Burkholderia sp. S-53]|uniref:FecR family protein n=1 Tax=Burkholderia sp. S-53 TaxID=2906514 RepID=UPI0021D31EA9|nr:FecR domain-containing protein [Burkholderia sp. S-53]UXU89590.1 FecR domain-containing protein [Burkholderia sp. S-53]